MNKLIATMMIIGAVIMSGCTVPSYERTVVKTYDGDGKLLS